MMNEGQIGQTKLSRAESVHNKETIKRQELQHITNNNTETLQT